MQLEVIGKFIAKLRREKKLTQKDLGEILNVESKTISKWERGKYAPDIMILKDLSKIFEISIEEILEGKRKEIEHLEDSLLVNELDQSQIIKDMKIKHCIITIIIVFTVIIIFSVILVLKNNEQFIIKYFTNTNSLNYDLAGKIIYNKNKTIYIFGDFVYTDDKVGTDNEIKILNSKISLIINNDVIYTSYKEYYESIPLRVAVGNFQINIEEKNKLYNEGDNISIRIEFKDIYNDEHSILLLVK